MNKIKEYFESKRVSNSLLGALNNPRYIWLRQQGLIEDSDKPFFRIGSGIDCLLTDPERWNEEFVVSEGNRPGGLMGKFVDTLPRYITKNSDEEDYRVAYNAAGYKASITNIIKWFWENESTTQYYKDRWLVEGDKTLLSKTEYESIEYAVNVIKENEYTRRFFLPEESESNIERILQLPIYFNIYEVECKSLLDGVIIDHTNKTIQLFDLKSTGKSVLDFPQSFVQFSYQRQAAFYDLAFNQYLQDRATWDTKDIHTYQILPFKFIVVESRAGSYSPALIYECSKNDMICGLFGGYNNQNNTRSRGIYDLIEDYRWHTANNKWLMPREAYENEGKLLLDTFIPLNVYS